MGFVCLVGWDNNVGVACDCSNGQRSDLNRPQLVGQVDAEAAVVRDPRIVIRIVVVPLCPDDIVEFSEVLLAHVRRVGEGLKNKGT